MMWRRAVRRDGSAGRVQVVDVIVAVGFAGLAVAEALAGHLWPGPKGLAATAAGVSGLALAWRRSYPLGSFTVALAAQVILSLAYGHYEAGTSLLIGILAAYSAAAYRRNPRFVLVVAAGFVVAFNVPRQPFDEAVGDSVFTIVMLGLSVALGIAMRSRVDRAGALEARTLELERQSDEAAAAAAAEERRRIARELHDIVSHSLGLVVLQANAADEMLERDPERARQALGLIRRVGQEAIAEMGTLVGLMRDGQVAPREPQPSLADLGGLIATTQAAGLGVELAIEGEPRPLPAAVELSAFRVVQEGLTNALKYAGPAHAHVLLRYWDDELEVEVVDDGVGTAERGGGRHGLAGIRERVAVFGGRFQAGPRASGGWQLRAAFPVGR
jgi:signal transduction histidine kinase